MLADVAAQQREWRRLIVEECIALIRETYDREPLDAADMKRKSDTWLLALDDIPGEEIRGVTLEVIRTHNSAFLPTPRDLLARWRGEEIRDGEYVKPPLVAVANAGAYQPLAPTANEKYFRGGAGHDGAGRSGTEAEDEAPSPERAAFQDLRARLWPSRSAPEAPLVRPRAAPRDDVALGRALVDYCEFETWRARREVWTAFGEWLLEKVEVEKWTPDIARRGWEKWQRIQAKAE